MIDDRNERRLARLGFLFAAAVGLWPFLARIDLTLEDGFYYFRIAQLVAEGAGSTFDGLHPTNGYHPLWLLALVPHLRPRRGRHGSPTLAHLFQGLLAIAGGATTASA